MAKMLEIVKDEEVIDNLLELLLVSVPCARSCVDAIIGWDCVESLSLVTKLRGRYGAPPPTGEIQKTDFWLEILPIVSKAFPNSAKKVLDAFDNMIDNHESDDPLSLERIPTWFKEMTEAGFSRTVIESWCTSLVLYENLSSSDVDAIANLNPKTIESISKEPEEIQKCLFVKTAPKTWRNDNNSSQDDENTSTAHKTSIDSFKRCLQFAKILNEFASIAMQLKENNQILERIKDGIHDLCSSFLENQSSTSGLYKTRDSIFQELSVLLFSGKTDINEQSFSKLSLRSDLSRGLTAVFRRLARSVVKRPILFGHVKAVVHQTLVIIDNLDSCEYDYQTVQNAIHKYVIELDPNQDAIHSLQTAGYNQGSYDEDLWYSTCIQLSSYVPAVKSFLQDRLVRVLQHILMEWRGILTNLEIKEVDFNGYKINTNELVNFSDSLEIVKSKLEWVKQATQNTPPNHWSSTRRRQLIKKERKADMAIAKASKQKRDEQEENQAAKLAKVVIVWDNKLVKTKSMKTCSEKIPGCYAPNGFHSEKPVICGLAVDNRILTLYQQEKSKSLTELEDVEVKLFPVGMLVYGIYRSSHCYDTDQLWAAFFKMLLLKRLVPKIFLTNISPGFQWIAKNRFVEPEASTPGGITFNQCNTLIPTKEDSYDYDPNLSLHRLHSGLSDYQMEEFIILTPDNVKEVEFSSLMSPKRDPLIRNLMETVPESVHNDSRFKEMHQDAETRKQLINRLKFAIRKAAEISVDEQIPEQETVSRYIDLNKLSSACKDSHKVQENLERFYGEIIVDAFHTEMDGNTEYSKVYDCCEHVEFLHSNESTPQRLDE